MEIMSAAGWRIKSGVSHSLSLVFSFEGARQPQKVTKMLTKPIPITFRGPHNFDYRSEYCQQLPVARRRAM
jgi:hypothetical protein